jgi:hypothetical protein
MSDSNSTDGTLCPDCGATISRIMPAELCPVCLWTTAMGNIVSVNDTDVVNPGSISEWKSGEVTLHSANISLADSESFPFDQTRKGEKYPCIVGDYELQQEIALCGAPDSVESPGGAENDSRREVFQSG